jgi:alpha-1,2-glucosyltransferase
VFHIPQARRFCARDWTYDAKLTTPPGVYLLSLALHRLVPAALTGARACADVAFLRGTNVLLLLLLPHLVGALRSVLLAADALPPAYAAAVTQQQAPARSATRTAGMRADAPARAALRSRRAKAAPPALLANEPQLTLADVLDAEDAAALGTRAAWRAAEAHAVASLPPLVFFACLYYTDVGAVVCVVAALLMARLHRHVSAAAVSGRGKQGRGGGGRAVGVLCGRRAIDCYLLSRPSFTCPASLSLRTDSRPP